MELLWNSAVISTFSTEIPLENVIIPLNYSTEFLSISSGIVDHIPVECHCSISLVIFQIISLCLAL